MSDNINDIYYDLKHLVEKTHKIIVLNEKTTKESNKTQQIKEKTKPTQNIKFTTKEKSKKTQSSQTTTIKSTSPQTHLYVSLPPAGRKGTKTDNSIISWSHSLRGYYF